MNWDELTVQKLGKADDQPCRRAEAWDVGSSVAAAEGVSCPSLGSHHQDHSKNKQTLRQCIFFVGSCPVSRCCGPGPHPSLYPSESLNFSPHMICSKYLQIKTSKVKITS